MINEIYQKGELKFYQEDWQVIGMRYPNQGKEYVITAAAYDQYGYNKLNRLLKNSIIVFVISILFIYIAGRVFSKKAFEPVKEMTEKAANISAINLDLRLPSNGSKDELSELANTFNEMLNRLENSFEAQKHFVSNISHELRTPLAAIVTELELAANKERSIDEYKLIIKNTLTDAERLVRLSNSLLDLAKASYDLSEIAFKKIRVDEVLLDAIQQTKQVNPEYNIDIRFENDFNDDNQISVNGNEYLLKVAFVTLMENGCKFSDDKSCSVSISFNQSEIRNPKSKITLNFTDKGIGISEEDLQHIFTPFYRGENKPFAEGNGIGLYLTQKIIHLHKGSITIQSKQQQGTTFTVDLQTV